MKNPTERLRAAARQLLHHSRLGVLTSLDLELLAETLASYDAEQPPFLVWADGEPVMAGTLEQVLVHCTLTPEQQKSVRESPPGRKVVTAIGAWVERIR